MSNQKDWLVSWQIQFPENSTNMVEGIHMVLWWVSEHAKELLTRFVTRERLTDEDCIDLPWHKNQEANTNQSVYA